MLCTATFWTSNTDLVSLCFEMLYTRLIIGKALTKFNRFIMLLFSGYNTVNIMNINEIYKYITT